MVKIERVYSGIDTYQRIEVDWIQTVEGRQMYILPG